MIIIQQYECYKNVSKGIIQRTKRKVNYEILLEIEVTFFSYYIMKIVIQVED